VREWLANIRSAAPRHEAPLVELLSQVGSGRRRQCVALYMGRTWQGCLQREEPAQGSGAGWVSRARHACLVTVCEELRALSSCCELSAVYIPCRACTPSNCSGRGAAS
jgi:hypothetical protein